MDDLIERLRSEAEISDRPGQMDRLNALADEFAAVLASRRSASVGEEIMVNTPYDVFTLPLQPSGLSNGPRFVVHVPGQPAASAEPVAAVVREHDGRAFTVLRPAGENLPDGTELYAAIDAEQQRPQPEEQHPDDAAVDRFAAVMKAKLTKKRSEGRTGWQEANSVYLSELLREHVEKGDPVDVANLAMMLHQNGQRIEQQLQPAPAAHEGPSEVDMDEYRAMVAAMEQIDPATLPGLTAAQRCALSRFAKPAGGPAGDAQPMPADIELPPLPKASKMITLHGEETAATEPTSRDDDMDIVICPGCGEDVPHDNNGCPRCDYENGWNGADGRLMTLRELLAAPSYPELGAMELNNVCPAFLRRLAEESVKAHNDAAIASQANRELELIKTLQMLRDQRNCRYEIEAQFGTDIWQVLERDNKHD